MQMIDSLQQRTPDRLRADEISAWLPDFFDENLSNHIKSLIKTNVKSFIICLCHGMLQYISTDAPKTLQSVKPGYMIEPHNRGVTEHGKVHFPKN